MKEYKVIIIGSGFGGQCAAIKLKKSGIDDFLILERRGFMGGTWCQNAYPGAAVDVQSPLYSLESEPYDWSQLFVEGDELQRYTNFVIDKHNLRDKTQTNANVTEIKWLDKQQLWQISVENRATFVTQFIINASGPLSTPIIPNFKGKELFDGASFHTNNWDASYDYEGKRIAIIGSGASAAQVIPSIADKAEHLHVFQRAPHWVLPRSDYTFKKWQRKLLRNKWLYKILRVAIYWTLEMRVIGFKYSDFMLKLLAHNKAVKHLKNQIEDPEFRKKLTPNFTIGCKRVLLSNTLYPTLCREDVTVHCTESDQEQSIAEITANGIKTVNGQDIDLDLIVYATGYDATDGVISYPVIGKNNVLLSEKWREYPRAYMGTCIPDFPNLFIVTGPNTGIGHTSAIFLIEAQMHYIFACINAVEKENAKAIEVRSEAESKYTNYIHQEMKKTIWQTGGCNSWYKSKSGHVVAMFPGFSFTFLRWTKKFHPNDHTVT